MPTITDPIAEAAAEAGVQLEDTPIVFDSAAAEAWENYLQARADHAASKGGAE